MIVAARTWARTHPNRSLVIAGLAMILVPWLIDFWGVLILELFLPEDPEQYSRIGKYDAGFIFSWWIIIMNSVVAITAPIGLLVLAFASWRTFRDWRRRQVKPPAPNPDAASDAK